MLKKACLLFIVLNLIPHFVLAETIDVNIKGVDDGVKTTKQQDYKEAVLFAKREAIERAGVKIKALTTARDFVVHSDYIESEAEAVLLSGYNIVDVGYQQDGTYLIVLIGKVKTATDGIASKELRYAKNLVNRSEKSKAKKIISDIIKNSKDDNTVAEAMYCQVIWGFSPDPTDTFEKMKAYYPDSKYVSRLKSYFDGMTDEEIRVITIKAKIGNIIGKDGRFIAGDKGIVLDTKTGLMWAAKDNGRDINWENAKRYCENYQGGEYTDWRMPKLGELKNLYDPSKRNRHGYYITRLIDITSYAPWTSETSGSSIVVGYFGDGGPVGARGPLRYQTGRALPVRDGR